MIASMKARGTDKADKKVVKLMEKVEKHYKGHNVSVEIPYYFDREDGNGYIFRVELKKGAREQLVNARAGDIQVALQLPIFQPFKKGQEIYIAISEKEITVNSFQILFHDKELLKNCHSKKIPYIVGYDMVGRIVVVDLAELYHLLIGGASGSGKSVALRCMVSSIIVTKSPSEVNLILFDVGANDLSVFDGIPHLSHPVIKDAERGIAVMLALEAEMERRIAEPDQHKNRPDIVCVADEFVSFISGVRNKKKAEMLTEAISNLLRRGRHAGIHMVLATQDPTTKSMKVDLGSIASRIAFACAKPHNSVAMLGKGGAEKLQGNGAMLLKYHQNTEPEFLQGIYISEDEVIAIIENICSRNHSDFRGKYVISQSEILHVMPQQTITPNNETARENAKAAEKELVDIIVWALTQKTVSALQIQKIFRMGNRANKILDRMSDMGIVADKYANLPRTVLPISGNDLPPETQEFLLKYGLDEYELNYAISDRFIEEE